MARRYVYFCDCCKIYNSRYVACDNLAVKDNKILLVRRAKGPYLGYWCLPGGYLDWDETAEECAKRELYEETGYKANVKFLGIDSNPDRSERQNVVLVFRSEVKERDNKFDELNETLDVKWFDLDKIPKKIVPHHLKFIKKYVIKKS